MRAGKYFSAKLGLALTLAVLPVALIGADMKDMKKTGTTSPAGFTPADVAREAVIIDLHSDALDQMYWAGQDVALFGGNKLQSGLPALKRGGIKAQFFAVWEKPKQKKRYADELVALFYKMLDTYSSDLAFAGSVADLERNLAAGKISAFLAIEGGEAIGGDLSRLDYFYGKGVRYMTLTWNHTNLIADSAKEAKRTGGGLTPFGRKVVARMNELGMMVDVSHASDQAVRDVLAVGRAPVIASHSDCWALKKHPRNLKDELIRGICQSGGVIGANYHRTFLVTGRPARAGDVADQIDHIVAVGGIGCAALGSDFDGGIFPPQDLANAGELENLTAELIRRGYTRADIEKIYGGNVMRVMEAVMGKDR
ncbi:MAG TPA: dipeptidase [bacterium]|nr:dipeptidase [bacterium]